MKIAVIGSAGRSGKYTYDSFMKMVKTTIEFLRKYDNIEIVSGGAAGADHICFNLSKIYQTTIYAPCKWDGDKYYDSGEVDFRKNPGGTANYYHRKFMRETGIDSLNQLKCALEDESIKYIECDGFHSRNSKIAESDILIAFTFSQTIDGGTLDTWKKCKGEKFHFIIE